MRHTLLLSIMLLLGFVQPAFSGSGTIVIFHTNDLHAHFLPEEASWRSDHALIGGFEAIEQTLERERGTVGPSLYLDGGDFMTGTPISDMEHMGVKGGAIVEFYNLISLDAMAIGNHEFDHSLDNLKQQFRMANFPILGANLHDADGNLFTGEAYRIFEVGEVRVGVIGITTDALGSLLNRASYPGIRIDTGVETLERLVPEIDPQTDLILVLSHEGIGTDREIAEQVEGIDIIVGGHSHTRIEEGEWVNGVLIVQAGGNGRYLGRASLTVRDDHIEKAECILIPTLAGDADGSTAVRALTENYEKKIIEIFGAVIAQASAHLGRGRSGESELGNWLADRMREIAEADVALVNSGGIRSDIRSGPVTRLDIQAVLPFSNALCTFHCTGEDLLAFALHNAKAEAEGTHGILQISGLEYSWTRKDGDIEIFVALVNGLPVDPAKEYKVTSVDYVAVSQPDKYLGFEPGEMEYMSGTLTTQVMEAVEKLGKIDPPGTGRIREVTVDYAPPTGQ